MEQTGAKAIVLVLDDELLLEAMVENLVRNAVRFSPPDSLVQVRHDVRGDSVALRVIDSGPGVAPEHLIPVFDWFFEADDRDRRTAGHGFGLAIAKRVAEHRDGTLTRTNRSEGGCEFEVRLPLWRDDQSPVGAAATTRPT